MRKSFEHATTGVWEDFAYPEDFPIRIMKFSNTYTTTDIHRHDFLEIFLVLAGAGRYLSEEGDIQLSVGDMFFLSPSQIHGFQAQEGLSVYNILIRDLMTLLNFTPECSTSILQLFFSQTNLFITSAPLSSHLHLNPVQHEAVVRILDSMYAENLSLRQNFATMQKLLFGQLFITLERCCRINKVPFATYPLPILKAIMYIHQNYGSEITNSKLASLANMTEKTFYRHFKQATGMTSSEYLGKLRLERASMMLKNSDAPIAEIAFQCGYPSNIYFSQLFKRHYALTPWEYRKAQIAPQGQ